MNELHGSEFELSKPRTVGCKVTHRNNVDVTTAEEYYCISLLKLNKHFKNDLAHSVGLLQLLPTRAPHDPSRPLQGG